MLQHIAFSIVALYAVALGDLRVTDPAERAANRVDDVRFHAHLLRVAVTTEREPDLRSLTSPTTGLRLKENVTRKWCDRNKGDVWLANEKDSKLGTCYWKNLTDRGITTVWDLISAASAANASKQLANCSRVTSCLVALPGSEATLMTHEQMRNTNLSAASRMP